mmetsp:Transcript_49055/g.56504  ORF Transcript_49055/g.56504 Transcript_49055/m.56504 type:complete len:118 (+) Transcript_49055:42-395(+)
MQTQNNSECAWDLMAELTSPTRIMSPTPRRSLSLEFLDDTLTTTDNTTSVVSDFETFEELRLLSGRSSTVSQLFTESIPSRVSNPVIFDTRFEELEKRTETLFVLEHLEGEPILIGA